MTLRIRINDAVKSAMKAKEADRLSTLRMVNAKIKDEDIKARGAGKDEGVSDADLLAHLAKMVKQRHESAKAFDDGGRDEMAAKERAEIAVIEEFLPKQLDDAETAAAIDAAISEVGATSLRDMGKVMGILKTKYTGQLDFGKAGGAIKAKLG